MKLLTIAWLGALAIAVPAVAAESQPIPSAPTAATGAAADTAAKSKPVKERRICTEEQGVGSKIPRRVCRTVSQAEEERRLSRDARERFYRGEQPTAPGGSN